MAKFIRGNYFPTRRCRTTVQRPECSNRIARTICLEIWERTTGHYQHQQWHHGADRSGDSGDDEILSWCGNDTINGGAGGYVLWCGARVDTVMAALFPIISRVASMTVIC
jgi:hypothetical protein